MPFLLTRTDLRELRVDAKVIASNPYWNSRSSTEWQPDLWAEQRRIQQLPPGESMLTSGKEFDAKYGIVTVPPIWQGGERKEALHLAACYDSALRLAHRRRCKSIAFPLLSGDCNGFPKDLALKTAIATIREFLNKHEMLVYLSVKDAWARLLPKPEIEGLNRVQREKSPQELFLEAIKGQKTSESDVSSESSGGAPQTTGGFLKPKTRQQDIKKADDAFASSLLELAEGKGLTDQQLCQKANLDRRVLSDIRKNSNYRPSKTTALALAVAMELNLEETKQLTRKAGFQMAEDCRFDMILSHYIEQGQFDIYDINQTLFVFEEPQLGQ